RRRRHQCRGRCGVGRPVTRRVAAALPNAPGRAARLSHGRARDALAQERRPSPVLPRGDDDALRGASGGSGGHPGGCGVMTLRELLDGAAAGLEEATALAEPDGGTAWSRAGLAFAAVESGDAAASFRLDAAVAAAAART